MTQLFSGWLFDWVNKANFITYLNQACITQVSKKYSSATTAKQPQPNRKIKLHDERANTTIATLQLNEEN